MRYAAYCMTCMMTLCGCVPSAKPTIGGTTGTLTAGEISVPDFEVKVFEAGSAKLLGLGVTGSDGKFQLMLPQGDGPMWLTPGEYAFTLDSVGPSAPRIPTNYSNPSKTPLKVKWKSDDQVIDLRIPAFK